jgi:YidC/Oxa1 family membrane protein insertase
VDKRTIIAVILIAMLFIVYTTFIRKPQEQKQDVEQKEGMVVEKLEGEVKEEKEGKEVKEEKKTEEEAVEILTQEQKDEKIIKVKTNLYEAEFSTIGATLRSMKLLEYPGKEDKPVELIPEGSNPLSISLVGLEDKLDISKYPAVCKKDSIHLTVGLRDSLVFYYTENDTAFLKKVFIFEPNSYLIDLHIESINKTPYSMKLEFDSGLNLTEKDEKDEMAYTSFVSMLGEHFQRMNLKNVKEEKSSIEGTINWAGVTTKYFLFFILPENDIISKVSQWKIEKKRIGFSVTTKQLERADFSLYFGPINYYKLKDMGNGLEMSVYFGWKWIAPISRVIFFIFRGINKVIPNYGVVIIIFSVMRILLEAVFHFSFRCQCSLHCMQCFEVLLNLEGHHSCSGSRIYL